MERSLETRWFFRHSPFKLFDFFERIAKPQVSVDWYLYSTPGNCMSEIKLRKSHFETKFLLSKIGNSTFGPAEGIVEEWAKWSIHLNGNGVPSSHLLENTGWIPIKKSRYIKIFEIKDNSISEFRTNGKDLPENGVRFEFAELFVEDILWWTIGFKSFGRKEELANNLKLTANLVFSQINSNLLCKLRDFNSYSYPKWLQQV